MWSFLKRHKRKIAVTGGIVSGLYLVGKFVQWKLAKWQEEAATDALKLTKKQYHFDNNQRTCNTSGLSMLNNLRKRLMCLLDTESMIQLLKQKPESKLDIWEDIKILSFTRTISAIYSSTMLLFFLRVQLNIMGGYMYLDSIENKNDFETENGLQAVPPTVQKRYLALVEYLLGTGLERLINRVRVAVEKAIGSVSLKEQLSLKKLGDVLQEVRAEVELCQTVDCQERRQGTHNCMLQYILDPESAKLEEACATLREDTIAQHLADETRDVLESEDFQKLLSCGFDKGFSFLLDCLVQFCKPNGPNGHVDVNLNEMTLPLAKIIPVVNGLIHSICSDQSSRYVKELIMMENLQDFAANVYEAFSQPKVNF